MYRQALTGYERVSGPEHKSTLVTMNNLGMLYLKQEKLPDDDPMFQRALNRYEKVLGRLFVLAIRRPEVYQLS
jgi:hypothetical protein